MLTGAWCYHSRLGGCRDVRKCLYRGCLSSQRAHYHYYVKAQLLPIPYICLKLRQTLLHTAQWHVMEIGYGIVIFTTHHIMFYVGKSF